MKTKLAAIVSALVLTAAAGACDKKKKGGGTSSSWIVGGNGSMLRFDAVDGGVTDYSLETDADLLDIACRGAESAWVVGEQGTMLRTLDGGETWEAIDVGISGDLHAVAAAGFDVVYAAGDGSLLASGDSGSSWRRVPGSDRAWTDVATTYDGRVALATTADGGVFRYRAELDRLEQVYAGAAALHGISITADGVRAVAVGDRVVLDSASGGLAWTARADAAGLPALHRVQLAGDGSLAVALGDAGTVAHIGNAGVDAVQLLGEGRALRALHVSASGHAIAVGDGGAAFVSDDAGYTWTAVDLGADATWYGVDDLHGEPHL